MVNELLEQDQAAKRLELAQHKALLVDTFVYLLALARHPDTTNRQRARAEFCTRVLAGNADRVFVGTEDGVVVELPARERRVGARTDAERADARSHGLDPRMTVYRDEPRADVNGNALHE